MLAAALQVWCRCECPPAYVVSISQRDSRGLPPLTWGLRHGSRRFVQRHGCQPSAAGCIGRPKYCSASQLLLISRLPHISCKLPYLRMFAQRSASRLSDPS